VEVFDQADVHHVTTALADLGGLPGPMTTERVQTAVVLLSDGDMARFERQLRLARTDWRDVLVAAGLADEDWAGRLDAELGPAGGH
jgi:hypothetical protein